MSSAIQNSLKFDDNLTPAPMDLYDRWKLCDERTSWEEPLFASAIEFFEDNPDLHSEDAKELAEELVRRAFLITRYEEGDIALQYLQHCENL